jgi:hypothetical protein
MEYPRWSKAFYRLEGLCRKFARSYVRAIIAPILQHDNPKWQNRKRHPPERRSYTGIVWLCWLPLPASCWQQRIKIHRPPCRYHQFSYSFKKAKMRLTCSNHKFREFVTSPIQQIPVISTDFSIT